MHDLLPCHWEYKKFCTKKSILTHFHSYMKINTFSFSPWVATQWYSWISEEIISWNFSSGQFFANNDWIHGHTNPIHWSMHCQNSSFHFLSPCCEGHKNELSLQRNSFIVQSLCAVSNQGDSYKEDYYSLLDILINRSFQNICLMTIKMVKILVNYKIQCVSFWLI